MSFTSFQDHISQAIARTGSGETLRAIAVCAAYKKVVGKLLGEDLVPMLKPTYRDGVLTVQASGSAFLNELRLRETMIQQELTRALGKETPKKMRLVGGRR